MNLILKLLLLFYVLQSNYTQYSKKLGVKLILKLLPKLILICPYFQSYLILKLLPKLLLLYLLFHSYQDSKKSGMSLILKLLPKLLLLYSQSDCYEDSRKSRKTLIAKLLPKLLLLYHQFGNFSYLIYWYIDKVCSKC